MPSSSFLTLFLLTSIFFIGFLSRISLAPLLPHIERDFSLTHGGAGAIFLFLSLGYAVGLILSSFLSSKLTHRKMVFISAFFSGIVLLLFTFGAGDILTLKCLFWGLGVALGIYLPSGIATLTSVFEERHWGKAIAIHEFAPNSSFVLSPLIVQALLEMTKWKHIFMLFGLISLSLSFVFLIFGKGGNFKAQVPTPSALKILIKNRSLILMAIIMGLGVGASLGVYNMLPLYLIAERNLNEKTANTLIALSRILSIGASFFSGMISDKFGPKRTLKLVFWGSALSTFLLGSVEKPLIPLVLLQAIFVASFFPPAFSMLSHMVEPQLRNLSVSFAVLSGTIVGGGVIPALIGTIGDIYTLGMGFSTFGLSLLIAPYLLSKIPISFSMK